MTRVLLTFCCLIVLAGTALAEGPEFSSSVTAHFVFYYVKDSAADHDLAQIAANREAAYDVITTSLGVESKEKLAVYLYPTRESTEGGRGTGTTFRDGSGVSVNYFDFAPSFERTHYGHELTHAIAYRLTGSHHDVPLLAEGLAEYLDQSGRDLYAEASSCVRIFGQRETLRVESRGDLSYEDFTGRCGYERSGSFVRFLIESFGWEKFIKFYKATAKLGEDFPEKRLSDLAGRLSLIYSSDLDSIEAEWNQAVSEHKKELPRPPPDDEQAIRRLFSSQDSAADRHYSTRVRDAYDLIDEGRLPQFENMVSDYTDRLDRTEVLDIFDLGIKNGESALAHVIRHLKNGRALRLSCRLEKMEGGWKIHQEDPVAVGELLQDTRESDRQNILDATAESRLNEKTKGAITEVFRAQDAAAGSHNAEALRSTYDQFAEKRIPRFQGNLSYYAANLENTQVVAISGQEGKPTALVLTVRRFRNGRRFRITYRLRETSAGWKIEDEDWLR